MGTSGDEAAEARAALTTLCRALREDVDGLADELTLRILDGEDAYAERGVAVRDDLHATCRSNLDRVLLVLSGDLPSDTDRAALTVRTGELRARQGVPLEVVLRAYRLCGRMLWDRMRAVSRDRFDGALDHALLGVANELWRTIDHSSARLVSAYRTEEARRHGRDVGRRYAVVEGLLEGRGQDPTFAAEAVRLLALPPRGTLLCVSVPAAASDHDPLDRPGEALHGAGVVSVWHRRRDELVGLVALDAVRGAEVVVEVLRGCAAGPVGVSPPVDGLGDVPAALQDARLAARTLPAGATAVAPLDERLPEALLAQSPRIAARLGRNALGGLLDLPDAERRLLLGTLRSVLAADGSPARAARALFCHRNTVMYRLGRIRDLTGRSLHDPRDRLLLALGLLTDR